MADATISDRLVVAIDADLSSLSRSLSQAGRDVNQFASGTVGSAARSMTGAFDASFGALERSVARAARSGQLSIRMMVNAVLADLARVAVQKFVLPGLETASRGLTQALSSAFSGLAVGGPVGPGSAYVVGEHGPEVFVPAGNGEVVPNAKLSRGRPQIVLNVQTANAESFLKSEAQITAMLTRAALRGQRNL